MAANSTNTSWVDEGAEALERKGFDWRYCARGQLVAMKNGEDLASFTDMAELQAWLQNPVKQAPKRRTMTVEKVLA